MSGHYLTVSGVSKRFGGLQALNDCSFTLDQGLITCLVGPNGAGKTTVFNVITGFTRPEKGEIKLGEQPLIGLSARRMVVVIGPQQRRLRADPDEKAPYLASLDPNVMGRLMSCPRDKAYCKVDVENIQGWLKRDEFWGVYPQEYIE